MATTSESQATTAEVTTTTATLVDGEDAEELPDASRQQVATTPAAPENRVTTPYVSKCRCPIAPSRGLGVWQRQSDVILIFVVVAVVVVSVGPLLLLLWLGNFNYNCICKYQQ